LCRELKCSNSRAAVYPQRLSPYRSSHGQLVRASKEGSMSAPIALLARHSASRRLVPTGLLLVALTAWAAAPAHAQDIGPGALIQELSALSDATPHSADVAASSKDSSRPKAPIRSASGPAVKPTFPAKTGAPVLQASLDPAAPAAQNR
jgi:hypothetical protein